MEQLFKKFFKTFVISRHDRESDFSTNNSNNLSENNISKHGLIQNQRVGNSTLASLLISDGTIIQKILYWCSISTLSSISEANRLLHSHVHDPLFWKRLCRKNKFRPISTDLPTIIVAEPNVAPIDYQKMFRDNYITHSNWTRGKYTRWLSMVLFQPPSRQVLPDSTDTDNLEQQQQQHGNFVYYLFINAMHAVAIRTISGEGQLWDLQSGQKLSSFTRNRITSVASGANYLVTGSADGTISVWSIPSNRHKWANYESSSIAAISKADSLRPNLGVDMNIEQDTANECILLTGHQAEVSTLLFNESEMIIISGSEDWTVRVWKGHEKPIRKALVHYAKVLTFECIHVLQGHQGPVCCLDFLVPPTKTALRANTDNIEIYSGSVDQTVRIWNFKTGQCMQILKPYAIHFTGCGIIFAIKHDQCDNLFVACQDGTIRVYHCPRSNIKDLDDAQSTLMDDHMLIRVLDENKNSSAVVSLAINEAGMLASGYADGTIRIWNIREKPIRLQFVIKGEHLGVVGVLHIDQTKLVSGSVEMPPRLVVRYFGPTN